MQARLITKTRSIKQQEKRSRLRVSVVLRIQKMVDNEILPNFHDRSTKDKDVIGVNLFHTKVH